MDFYIFTQDYVPLGIVSTPTAVTYTEKFQSRGSFELYLPLNTDNISLMKKERVVLLDAARKLAGVIGIVKKEKASKDTNQLVVKGNLCEEYLYRRICWGLYDKTGKASAVIKDMVTTQVISPTDTNRAIADIVIDSTRADVGDSIVFQSTGGNVGENIEGICGANSLGFRLEYDAPNKQMPFYVYEGTDRTIEQSDVPPCIFSSNYENILSSSYTLNAQDSKNVGLVAGEGEGLARKTVSVGTASGKSRKEVFIDARDLQSTNSYGMTIPEAEYLQLLKQRGNEKMADLKETESFDCVVNTYGNIRYNEDYFLGDKVTIFDAELEIQLNAVITEVEHAFDSIGETIYITFGFGPLTLAQKLKAKVVQ